MYLKFKNMTWMHRNAQTLLRTLSSIWSFREERFSEWPHAFCEVILKLIRRYYIPRYNIISKVCCSMWTLQLYYCGQCFLSHWQFGLPERKIKHNEQNRNARFTTIGKKWELVEFSWWVYHSTPLKHDIVLPPVSYLKAKKHS